MGTLLVGAPMTLVLDPCSLDTVVGSLDALSRKVCVSCPFHFGRKPGRSSLRGGGSSWLLESHDSTPRWCAGAAAGSALSVELVACLAHVLALQEA